MPVGDVAETELVDHVIKVSRAAVCPLKCDIRSGLVVEGLKPAFNTGT
jgi:hypothetical protein